MGSFVKFMFWIYLAVNCSMAGVTFYSPRYLHTSFFLLLEATFSVFIN